jgi:hypothetical protein
VDLPAPFGPTYATDSPASTENEMPSTAVTDETLGRKRCFRAPGRQDSDQPA